MERLPFSHAERAELAFLMRFWVKNPRQEPLSTRVAELVLKICRIAAGRFFRDCPAEDREDMVMDMFRLMWQGLPKAYDPARCPKEINFVWFLMRCKMYMDGTWSRGYGSIGCPYTRGRRAVQAMRKDYELECLLNDEEARPGAHANDCRVTNINLPLS